MKSLKRYMGCISHVHLLHTVTSSVRIGICSVEVWILCHGIHRVYPTHWDGGETSPHVIQPRTGGGIFHINPRFHVTDVVFDLGWMQKIPWLRLYSTISSVSYYSNGWGKLSSVMKYTDVSTIIGLLFLSCKTTSNKSNFVSQAWIMPVFAHFLMSFIFQLPAPVQVSWRINDIIEWW